MAELDTAAERAELADPAIDADSMLYVLGKCTSYLDAYDRLRAENQRLKLAALTADRESMGLEAENQRLGEERDSLASSLAIETHKYRDAWDENQRLKDELKERSGRINEYADAIRWAVDNYHDLPLELQALVDKVARLAVASKGNGDE